MPAETTPAERRPHEKRQLRWIAAAFAAVTAVLAIGYLLFMRTDYAVLYDGLRPDAAAAIVAELDREGVPYRLGDRGSTILVPQERLDAIKLAIVGADLPLGGDVGFELFNESDMGLTEFAQKINYQRALQGEFARTIMAMDGIESARVHLAIPERTLFRRARSDTKAAVTVHVRRGARIDGARVDGIQQLVASAVPELAVSDVAVLDADGRVISPVSEDSGPDAGSDVGSPLERYYAERARRTIAEALPGLSVRVTATALSTGGLAPSGGEGELTRSDGMPVDAADRTFRVRLEVATTAPISGEDDMILRRTLAESLALDLGGGDTIAIRVHGAATRVPDFAAGEAAGGAAAVVRSASRDESKGWPISAWLALALVAAALAYAIVRSRRGGLTEEERAELADRLNAHLNARPGQDDHALA